MNLFNLMFKKFQNYMEGDVLSDIAIVVEDKTFKLHKVLLSAASDYFEKMFTVDMKEKEQGEIEIKDVTRQSFSKCMKYIYSGNIEIQMDEICDVLHTACLFQIQGIKDECVEFISSVVDPSNCMLLYKIAERYDCPKSVCDKCIQIIRGVISEHTCIEIYQFAKEYKCKDLEIKAGNEIKEYADNILTDDAMMAYMNEDTIHFILSSNELEISSEAVVFQGLYKWINANDDRKDRICDLMPLVKFPLINRSFFTNNVTHDVHLRRDCEQCGKYFYETVNYFIDGEKHGLENYQFKMRESNCKALLIEVPEGSYREKKLFIYNFKTHTMPQIQGIDTIHNSIYTYHENKLYAVCNGPEGRTFCNDLENQKTWQEFAPLPKDHNTSCFPPCVVNYFHCILAIGGSRKLSNNENWPLNNVSCFNTMNKTWDILSPLKHARSHITAVMVDKDVFSIGGRNKVEAVAYVEKYDHKLKDWICIPSLNVARSNSSSAFYNEKIFVAGGQELQSVETYHKSDSSWTLVSDLNVRRSGAGMIRVEEKLYIFGGGNKWFNNELRLFEFWDDNVKVWKKPQEKKYNSNSLDKYQVFTCQGIQKLC